MRDGTRIFGGRYRTTRLRKSGQGVDTYLGIDESLDAAVVIKAARASSMAKSAQQRLEHEALVLRDLSSPFIAPLCALGREEDQLFLVMPHLAGSTLEARLSSGPLSVSEVLRVAECLVAALSVAHDHGVLHRDVKPANIMVTGAPLIERATLIDFGLARSARLESSIREQPVGTVRYMSPEQAGLLSSDVGVRSDLYSMGVVLYEALTGAPPFQGTTIHELLRQHMTAQPASIRSVSPHVPRALEDVVQRLLKKDPRDRYQSAGGVSSDIVAIREALDHGSVDPPIVIGLRDRRASLTEPAFIGRADELSQLEAHIGLTRAGEGGVVLVSAESGGGKTRLLDELDKLARQARCSVVRGQGVDHEAQRPFQCLDGIVDAARSEPEIIESLRGSLGEHARIISAVLPELGVALGSPDKDTSPREAQAEARILPALARLLDGLGTASRPAIVLLDDCQWLGELEISLLARWARSAPSGGRHTLVIAGFRTEEIPIGHPLRAVECRCHIALSRLRPTDIRGVVESMAGPVPEDAMDVIYRLSEGSPFMAAAVLHGLVETGALAAEKRGWKIEPELLQEVQSSRRAAALISRRLERLSPTTRELLAIGALLGKTFELDLAVALAEKSPRQAIVAIDEGRMRQIVWVDGSERWCTFVHDRLREALIAEVPEDRRTQFHRRAAAHLESTDPTRVYDIAYHWDSAGEASRALPYAREAAERARAQSALEVAARNYQIAERGAAHECDRGTRREIAQNLGDVLMLRGQYEAARERFECAQRMADDPVDAANVLGRLGELELKRGDVRAAHEALTRAVGLLGDKVPRRPIALILALLKEVLVQALHTLFPATFVGRRNKKSDERREVTKSRLYGRLAFAQYFLGGLIPPLYAHLRGLNLAERLSPTLELAEAYSSHGVAMVSCLWFSRAARYAQRGLELRRLLGDRWGEGQALQRFNFVLMCAAKLETDNVRRACAIFERMGDPWEATLSLYQHAAVLYRLGDFGQALVPLRKLMRHGLELGDRMAISNGLEMMAKLTGGEVDESLIHSELEQASGDKYRQQALWQALAVRQLYRGSYDESISSFRRAAKIASEKGRLMGGAAAIPAWTATALRKALEHTPDIDGAKRKVLLLQLRKAIERATFVARLMKSNLPHALRERALLHAILGQPIRARSLLDRSISIAIAQKQMAEAAHSEVVRAEIGVGLGWPNARAELEKARGALRDLNAEFLVESKRSTVTPVDVSGTLSLADRFSTALDMGRKIASALTRPEVYAATRESAITLLRAEHCAVFAVDEESGAITEVTGETGHEHSRSILEQALERPRAIIVYDASSESLSASSDSVIMRGSRSVLCAPFFVRGRVAGAFYASHAHVTQLFNEEEQRLADFITTLTGAALENADGFSDVQALSKTLEMRVEQRTAQLAAANQELQTALERLRSSQEHLLHMAITDELTGLYTRRFFLETIRKEMDGLERKAGAISCLVIDVDHFKKVNDTHGHAVGDEVLRKVAAALRSTVRGSDTVARFGGEEFVVLLPMTTLENASLVAEKVRAGIESRVRDPVSATVSIGVASFVHPLPGRYTRPADETIDALLRRGDEALYRAKHGGRNRVELSD